jgi:hypothetical protein
VAYLREIDTKDAAWPEQVDFGDPDPQYDRILVAAEAKRRRITCMSAEDLWSMQDRVAFYLLLRWCQKHRIKGMFVATRYHLASEPAEFERLKGLLERRGIELLIAEEAA